MLLESLPEELVRRVLSDAVFTRTPGVRTPLAALMCVNKV